MWSVHRYPASFSAASCKENVWSVRAWVHASHHVIGCIWSPFFSGDQRRLTLGSMVMPVAGDGTTAPRPRPSSSSSLLLSPSPPISTAQAPRRRAKRRPRHGVSASVCGRTQYALHASASHHASAIMWGGRTHTQKLEPPPSPMSPPTPLRRDVLPSFSTHPASQLRSRSVKPVWLEGMGRVLLPHDAPREPAIPMYTPNTHRHALIAHWLAGDDDDDEPAPSSAPHDALHPMMAKSLRERVRSQPYPSCASSSFHDMWIGLDGTRILRGTKQLQPRRRVAWTMRSLLASGLVPSMVCHCGFTDEHMEVVQCDSCARWLHLACVGASHVDQLTAHEWVCDDCYNDTAVIAHSPHKGLHAHAQLRSTTLSLAPSPQRLRTPSPPPSSPSRAPALVDMVTPSRHFAPSTLPDWLPTPTSLLATSPGMMLRTPHSRVHRSVVPESPTPYTRSAQCTIPWSTPSFPGDTFSDGMGLSSPMPETPTAPMRSRLRGLPRMPHSSPSPSLKSLAPPTLLSWDET